MYHDKVVFQELGKVAGRLNLNLKLLHDSGRSGQVFCRDVKSILLSLEDVRYHLALQLPSEILLLLIGLQTLVFPVLLVQPLALSGHLRRLVCPEPGRLGPDPRWRPLDLNGLVHKRLFSFLVF